MNKDLPDKLTLHEDDFEARAIAGLNISKEASKSA